MNYTVYNNVVDKATMQTIYASRLQSMFSKFARSVTLQPTSVSIQIIEEMYANAPAWSDDTGMTLVHYPESGSLLSINNLTRLKGLAIHELSHLLFTPRSLTALSKWVNANRLQTTFNILEDNRIENFMVSRMSGVKPWLVHTITAELLKPNTNIDKLLPLVWGRKYLPDNIRTTAYKAWSSTVSPETADDIARIVDNYIVLTLHDKDEIEKAQLLIRQLSTLMNDNHSSAVHSHNHSTQDSCAPQSDGSKPLGKRDVADAKKDVAEQVASQSAPDSADDSEDEGDSGSSQGKPDTAGQLKAALTEAKQQAQSAVVEDVKSTIETVKSADSVSSFNDKDEYEARHRAILPANKYHVKQEAVSAEARSMAQLFTRELVHIRSDFDPGWVRKSDQGKLNVRDYMMGANFDEAFDLWDQGHEEATDIECVILLDNSGSMRDMSTPAYEAMWAIKRSLDAVDASTTVIQYGSWGNYLYQAHEKAQVKMTTARMEGGGSTKPLNSLVKANQILRESSRAIKMMITITDGQWDNTRACDQVIATMRSSGIVTGLVFLQDSKTPEIFIRRDAVGSQMIDAHYCEAATLLTEPRRIVEFAKQLTKVSRERVLTQ
jgi:hypothetical protein